MPRSWSRSSTFRSDTGKRMDIIAASRMISGLVWKVRNGAAFGDAPRLPTRSRRLKTGSYDSARPSTLAPGSEIIDELEDRDVPAIHAPFRETGG